MFKLATKEQRQNKSFVEKLLQIKGLDYDEWLDEQHLTYIQDSQSIILEALESKLNGVKSSSNTTNAANAINTSNTSDTSNPANGANNNSLSFK